MVDKTIEGYIAAQRDWRGDAIANIDAVVRKAAPNAAASIKWAQPVYEQNGPFAWIKANKHHVSFGFWRGSELSDPKGRLDGDGDRMRHVQVRSMADINKAQFTAWVKEAVKLNETKGNPTQRRG